MRRLYEGSQNIKNSLSCIGTLHVAGCAHFELYMYCMAVILAGISSEISLVFLWKFHGAHIFNTATIYTVSYK